MKNELEIGNKIEITLEIWFDQKLLIFFHFSFQTEDIQKLQLIPLQRPLITAKNLHEKRIQPENDPVNVPVTQPKPQQLNINDNNVVSTIDDENSQQTFNTSTSEIQCREYPIETICDDNRQHKDAINSTSKSIKKDIKRNKRLEKKRLKQQQKQLKKLNKKLKKQKNPNNETNNNNDANNEPDKKSNKNLPSNLKKRSQAHDIELPTVPSSSSCSNKTKSTANVKFVFDAIDNSNATNNHEQSNQNDDETITHNYIRTDIVVIESYNENNNDDTTATHNENNNSGDYDSLPVIKVEPSTDNIDGSFNIQCNNNEIYDGNGNVIATAATTTNAISLPPISCSSSDSIPFIDDSPNPRRATSVPIEQRRNLHDSRFITLQPRNIGAQSIIYARKIEKPIPIVIKIPPKRDLFDKSAQILYQSLKESIDHHFERAAHLNSKLCQVCHEFLLVPDAIKCLTCGLVCHQSCILPQVSFHKQLIFLFFT